MQAVGPQHLVDQSEVLAGPLAIVPKCPQPIAMSRKIRSIRCPRRAALEPAVRKISPCIASHASVSASRATMFSRRSSSRVNGIASSTLQRHASCHCSATWSSTASAAATFPTASPYQRW